MEGARKVDLFALLLQELVDGVRHPVALFHLLLEEIGTGLASGERERGA